ALAQPPAPAAGDAAAQVDRWAATVDPRVQQRTYVFADTNEEMHYALFVSSKVAKNKKNPVIISLHGLGGTHNTMVSTRLKTIDLAEEGGYIFAAPMGYNCGGWYGMPTRPRPAAAPAANAATGAPPAAPAQPAPQGAPQNGAPQGGPPRGPLVCPGGGTKVTDAVEVRELSEKDVMNVLAMVRKEFNVDDKRIYLMGHSMGASGTLYLGAKHADIWAAIAADAPPGAPNAEGIAAAKMPTLIIQGDADPAVPVAGTRGYVEKLKAGNADYKYIELPGVDHSISGIADMYDWFAKHTKH
ncbi:MAG TPA: alpha/beta hydrolase-fold protein, partial [Candidatus Acidoferrum sp.]|nr:alpha/beta hydrolase-fold protein [Candidatus Acidoferrum sp.]